LGGLGLGLVRVVDAADFAWAGPWIGCLGAGAGVRRFVVMYGVPSGVVFDPAPPGGRPGGTLIDGFVIAAADIALALPEPSPRPTTTGRVEAIVVAADAGARPRSLDSVRAL